MQKSLSALAADTAFGERASALGPLIPGTAVLSLDPMFERIRRFTAVRRREVRLSRITKAAPEVAANWHSHRDRLPDAVSAFGEGLKMLSEHAVALEPLITPALDDVFALAADEGHPLRGAVREAALAMGFSSEEAAWPFEELKGVGCRPVGLLCAGGSGDLTTLLSGISAGEAGLLLAGFVRFSGDPDLDGRLEKIIVRLREKGITASFFLALTIVLVAHAVAQHLSPR